MSLKHRKALGQKQTTHIYSIMKTSYLHITRHLTRKQVISIFEASEKAFEMDCALNRFFTIHLDDFVAPKRPQAFVIDLLEHTRKWLRRRDLPVSYVYTLENGKCKGIHVHLLIHIPAGYQTDYKRAMAAWLHFKIKKPWVAIETIQYPIYGSLSPMNSIYGALRYICKGINPQTPINDINPFNQGTITGRRWGISKSLK